MFLHTRTSDRDSSSRNATIAALISATLLTALSCYYLDHEVARIVKHITSTHLKAIRPFFNIPDFLPHIAASFVILFAIAYLVTKDRPKFVKFAAFCRVAALSVTASYAGKMLLKYVFGRANTRYWLTHQNVAEFLPFAGKAAYSGFPSGHMAVFAAMAGCCWLYYPKHKAFYATSLSVLAISLILTNYHFLGDVLGGAVLGCSVASLLAERELTEI